MLLFALASPVFASFSSVVMSPAGALYTFGAAIISAPLAAAGVMYAMKNPGISTVSSQGDVSRPSEAQWIDLTLPIPAVVKKPITAKMPLDKLKQINDAAPTVSPAINAVLHPPSYVTLPREIRVDVWYRETPGSYWNVTSKIWGPLLDAGVDQAFLTGSMPSSMGISVRAGGYSSQYRITAFSPVEPTLTKTTAETSSDLNAKLNPVVNTLNAPLYQAELDKMFQNPAYVPVFTDDTTGLPWAAPPNVATPSQVAQYNKDGLATEARAGATTALSAAAGTAQTAATNARVVATVARGAANAAPGDVGLNTEAVRLEGLADAADARAAAAAADLAGVAAEEAEGDAITAPTAGAAYGDGTTSDFGGRFNTFMDSMKSSGMFSLPGQLLGNIPSGGESTFLVNMGRFGSTTFDLAAYGSAIAIIRTLVLVVFSVAGFRIVTLKGGSG